jgi:hypothetical protein
MFAGRLLQWPLIVQVVSTERWTTYSHVCPVVPRNCWRVLGFILASLPHSLYCNLIILASLPHSLYCSLIIKYKFLLCSSFHCLNAYRFLCHGVHKSRAIKLCKMSPNIGWPSVSNLLRVTLPAPWIPKWLLHFRLQVPVVSIRLLLFQTRKF